MKTTLPTEIKTIPQAEAFLRELVKNGEEFDPSDDACLIVWNLPKEQRPTDQECHQLNKLMQDIFDLPGN